MRKLLILPIVAVASVATAQTTPRYLVSDANAPMRVTHCVLIRPTTPVSTTYESPAETVGSAKRCKIDLLTLGIPQVGTVTVAYKDSVAQEVGPTASFTFPDPIPTATGFRLTSN